MPDQITHPVAEPPREMSRDDRRIINDKLDEVYGKDAYKAPWTDAAVARDLGVPREWVSQVRESFFGPAGSNPLFDEFLARGAEIAKEIASIRTERAELNKATAALDSKCTALVAKVDELQRIGKRIEREIGR